MQLSGYKYLEGNKDKHRCALTIFSAPNYCKKYKNNGAVAKICNKGISITTYKWQTEPFCIPNHMNVFEWTIPFIAKSASHIFVKLMSKKLNIPIDSLNKYDL